jgi:two-component system sensor histidine kinase KdpD
LALVAVAAAIGLAYLAARLLPHANLSLVFLTAVLVVAARSGLGPALLTSVLSFLAFNFFFMPPRYTFQVGDDSDVATLLFFLLVAAVTGNLAARMRQAMEENRVGLDRVSRLADFARLLAAAPDRDQVLEILIRQLSQTTATPVVVLGPDAHGILVPQTRPVPEDLPSAEALGSLWTAAPGAGGQLGAWRFCPLATDRGVLGLVGTRAEPPSDADGDLLAGLCGQAALALDRVQLVTDLTQARLAAETEQLRSALLSSVSHDLRTPLATIIGASTSVLEYGSAFGEADRRELLATVVAEARRLDRYIQNLLDMTRLGQGPVDLRRDWVDPRDLIASALKRQHHSETRAQVEVQIPPDVPLLWVHGALVEQALVNLLDNAVSLSPAGGIVRIEAHRNGRQLCLEVCDQGPGIPPEEREKVFDMFYSLRRGDRTHAEGTGLGLAICRGLIGAHGGTVTAHDGPGGRGTCMRMCLPLTTPEEHGA